MELKKIPKGLDKVRAIPDNTGSQESEQRRRGGSTTSYSNDRNDLDIVETVRLTRERRREMKKALITTAAAALLLAGCASSHPTSLTEDVYNSMSPNAQQQMLNCQMDEVAAEASMSKAGNETGKVMMAGSE